MRRKVILGVLCIVTLFAITGCGNNLENNKEKEKKDNDTSVKTVVCTSNVEETDNVATMTLGLTYDKETLTLMEYKETADKKFLGNNVDKEKFMNRMEAYIEDFETINNGKDGYEGITATLDYDEENYSYYTLTQEYNIKQLSEKSFNIMLIHSYVDEKTFKLDLDKMKEDLEQEDSEFKCNW